MICAFAGGLAILHEVRTFFAALVPWATLAFAVSSMLSVGFAHSVREILWPLRRWRRVVGSLAANFVLAPGLAYILLRVFDLDVPHAIGLFLVGSAAGASFLIKLAQIARGDVAFAASLLAILVPCTVVFLSLVVPVAIPRAEVSAMAIAIPLVLSMILPLALGLFVRALAPNFASSAAPVMSRVASVSFVAVFVSIVVANWTELWTIGVRPAAAASLFILGTFGSGWLLGLRYRHLQDVLALGTAQRNIAAATVVATQTFGDLPGVLVMVTVTTVVGMVLLFPLSLGARWGARERFRRRHA